MVNFSPGELLDKLCNETLKFRANVVLYVEFQNDNPSSTEYLLQVINFLGIPVMAFTGESSSLVKVCLRIKSETRNTGTAQTSADISVLFPWHYSAAIWGKLVNYR